MCTFASFVDFPFSGGGGGGGGGRTREESNSKRWFKTF